MAECDRLWKQEKDLNAGNKDTIMEKLHGMATTTIGRIKSLREN
jgi:hypothetical protein